MYGSLADASQSLLETSSVTFRSRTNRSRESSRRDFERMRQLAFRLVGTDATASTETRWTIVRLSRAWTLLAGYAPRVAETLDLYYFGRLEAAGIALTLDRPVRQTEMELRFGQAWLTRALLQADLLHG